MADEPPVTPAPGDTTTNVDASVVDDAAHDRSMLWGMSIRAFLALIITTTFCLNALAYVVIPVVQLIQGVPTTLTIPEHLNNATLLVLGVYLGQKWK